MRLTERLVQITALLLVITFSTERIALAASTPDAASAKQQVASRGLGKGVKIREADGTSLRGKIVSLGEDSFGLQVGSKPAIDVPYAAVTEVQGPGLSRGARIGLWVGVGVLALVIVAGASYGRAVGSLGREL